MTSPKASSLRTTVNYPMQSPPHIANTTFSPPLQSAYPYNNMYPNSSYIENEVEYVPKKTYHKYIEYVPVERIVECIEYEKVEKSYINIPQNEYIVQQNSKLNTTISKNDGSLYRSTVHSPTVYTGFNSTYGVPMKALYPNVTVRGSPGNDKSPMENSVRTDKIRGTVKNNKK